MAVLPLGIDAWTRPFGEGPEIKVINRFFERNPANLVEGASLISRPATNFLYQLGDASITVTSQEVGTGGNSIATTETLTNGSFGGSTLSGGDASTAASGTLTLTGQPANDETVTIDTTTYTFKTTLTEDSTAPYQVLIGSCAADSLKNLVRAIAATTDLAARAYGTGTVAHTTVMAAGDKRIRQIWSQEGTFSGALFVIAGQTAYRIDKDGTTTALVGTISGDGTPIIDGTDARVFIADGTNLWMYTGSSTLQQITVPDSAAVVSVAVLNFFVLVLLSNSQRFYWIEPDAVTIDALNFAEAETKPDESTSLKVVGDYFWFFGKQSSEMWYHDTADADAPFKRQKGVAFTRGVVEGTDVRIDASRVAVIGDDNIAYLITNGQPQPISNNGISERVRLAKEAQFGAVLA